MAKLWMLFGLLAVVKGLPGFLSLPQVTPYIPIHDTFGDSFFAAFLSTLVIEARDKTFVLTAMLAATKMRTAVAVGALCSMAFLTVVDSLIGYIFVPLIEEGWVNWAAVIAYLVFCWLYIKDAWINDPKDMPDSLRTQEDQTSTSSLNPLREPLLDSKQFEPTPPGLPAAPTDEKSPEAAAEERSVRRRRWFNLFIKSAILMFLGEWSDATMVSTSEIAQKNTFWGVFCGCLLAYCITTTVAVFAGRWLGSKMKYRYLLVLTAFVFLLFAVFTVFY